MKSNIGQSPKVSVTTLGSLSSLLGRAVLWTAIGLLLVRGAADLLRSPTVPAPGRGTSVEAGRASDAFAIRFARTYLSDPSPEALLPFLAGGAHIGRGRPPSAPTEVGQAEVVSNRSLGGSRAVLTVACELRDSRTLYLAVPIARSEAGEVAALGAPAIVADPGRAGADSEERPHPHARADSGAIEALAERFLPAYVASSESSDLTYFLTAGVEVQPLGGAFELAAISGVEQLGSGDGPRRAVLVAARLTDRATGATYPVVYRLDLVRRARWYVRAIEGAVA